jgi:hypothetical protein
MRLDSPAKSGERKPRGHGEGPDRREVVAAGASRARSPHQPPEQLRAAAPKRPEDERFPAIPPKTLISISYLFFGVFTAEQIISYVGWQDGTAKRIPVMLQRVWPKWFNVTALVVFVAGVWVVVNVVLSLIRFLWMMARHFEPADQLLLQRHRLHRGAYVRVARKLGITPSSVSRVAGGGRQNERVMRALLRDLYRIDRLTLRVPVKRRSAC